MDARGEISPPPGLLAFAVSRWWDDPFAQGAWSTLNIQAPAQARITLGEPMAGRLLLAGEATHPSAPAMVHGAWAEGRRAAEWAAAEGHRAVIVVGAGFAGIACAARLRELGLGAIVVEAKDRIGGRVWSRPLAGGMVESGANWLQQGAANPLQSVARQAGFALCPTDFGRPLDLGPAHAITAISQPGLSAAMAQSLALAPPDQALSAWRAAWARTPGAPSRAAMDRIIAAEITLEAGLPLSEMTVASVSEPGVGEGDYWLPAGLGALLAAMAEGCDIRFGCPVASISLPSAGVLVAGARGAWRADAAIVTVPVGVLQSGGIRFDPPLPRRQQAALRGLTAGRVEKISLHFDRRFWPATSSGYLRLHGEEDDQVSEWLDMTDQAGAAVVSGIFAGDWARSLWQGSDAAIAARIARLLIDQARP